MGTRNIRRGVPALVLVTAGLALAACGPSDDSGSGPGSSSSPSASSSASPSPSSSAGAPASGTATRTADPSSAGGQTGGTGGTGGAAGGTPAPCATSHLKTTAESTGSGAGSSTFELVFQNTGSAPCTLRGYPGVSFVKAHNTQLGKAAARTGGGAVTTVTLIPNAHAYADLRTVNGQGGYSAGQCDLTTVPTLRVYPPNQTESTNIPWNAQECVGSTVQNLQIGPVHSNR